MKDRLAALYAWLTAVLFANYKRDAQTRTIPADWRSADSSGDRGTMKHILKVAVVLGLLLLPTSAAHAQVSFNFSFGTPPPPPRAYRVAPQPGPEFQWVEGYWYPING